MVIGVLITKVMSNIALVPYWCLFQLHSSTAQGQADWNLCNTFSYSMFPVFHVPHGRSNCCNGIWTGYVKIKEILKARNSMVIIGIILTVVILTLAKPFLG